MRLVMSAVAWGGFPADRAPSGSPPRPLATTSPVTSKPSFQEYATEIRIRILLKFYEALSITIDSWQIFGWPKEPRWGRHTESQGKIHRTGWGRTGCGWPNNIMQTTWIRRTKRTHLYSWRGLFPIRTHVHSWRGFFAFFNKNPWFLEGDFSGFHTREGAPFLKAHASNPPFPWFFLLIQLYALQGRKKASAGEANHFAGQVSVLPPAPQKNLQRTPKPHLPLFFTTGTAGNRQLGVKPNLQFWTEWL